MANLAGFPLATFFVRSDFLLNSHWLATLLEVKKVGSNPTFDCFRTKKRLLRMKKLTIEKTALTSIMSTGILQMLSKYPPHPAFSFQAMK